jgi:hypothetical protein
METKPASSSETWKIFVTGDKIVIEKAENSESPSAHLHTNVSATRRNVSRREILAGVGAAAVLSTTPEVRALSDESAQMIHMFAFRWKPIATEEQKNRAIAEIASFQGRVPGLLEVNIGKNISPRGQGYETGGVMKFKDADALAKYAAHPVHIELLTWLLPLIDPVEIDFPIFPQSR